MGFFKKIGQAVKKGVKQISLKNVVKLGTPLLSMVPVVGGLAQNIVGGISESHELRKQAKAETNAIRKAELEQQAYNLEQQALIKTGSVTGAIAGGTANAFINGTVNGLGAGALNGAGTLGAKLADSTIKAWFQAHWKKIAMGVGALIVAFVAWKKFGGAKKPTRRR